LFIFVPFHWCSRAPSNLSTDGAPRAYAPGFATILSARNPTLSGSRWLVPRRLHSWRLYHGKKAYDDFLRLYFQRTEAAGNILRRRSTNASKIVCGVTKIGFAKLCFAAEIIRRQFCKAGMRPIFYPLLPTLGSSAAKAISPSPVRPIAKQCNHRKR
jgi:hypothetical protein